MDFARSVLFRSYCVISFFSLIGAAMYEVLYSCPSDDTDVVTFDRTVQLIIICLAALLAGKEEKGLAKVNYV